MYRKILIANRGEIACRIARTLRSMGIRPAAVHSSADAGAPHVQEIGESVLIGDGPARQSYLDIDAVINAALRAGADAVHPGFGFLSENAEFARRCAQAGLAFIGPSPEVLELFGNKAAAKQLAAQLGIPTAGGLDIPCEDVDALTQAVTKMPLPCILKAVAGGGGKGMRVVREAGELRQAIESAIREGRSAFGDGRLIAERYLSAPRHVEVQILGDGQGGVIHLGDRECSLQRRYQKVVEEAPAGGIADTMRQQLREQALALGRASRYLGLGTVEFAVTGDDAVFLEVNPRLQVEHTVTEAVTGLDLVALQIQSVHSKRLPLSQAEVPAPRGVAVQARLYAEDAAQGFLPSTGRISVFDMPAGVRVDAGVAAGNEITPHYDPMIAKLISHAETRTAALAKLRAALSDATVLGVTSNRGFLLALLDDPAVRAGQVSTEFIDQWLAGQASAQPVPRQIAALAALWLRDRRCAGTPAHPSAWHDARLTGWRQQKGAPHNTPSAAPGWQARTTRGEWTLGFGAGRDGALRVRVDADSFSVSAPTACGAGWQLVAVDGHAVRLRAHLCERQVDALLGDEQITLDLAPLYSDVAGSGDARHGLVRAPMMGQVIGLHVRQGEVVAAGDRLATMESMKMEMPIVAPTAGTVAWIGCAANTKVERHQDLFHIEPAA